MSHLPRLPLDLLRTFVAFADLGNGKAVARLLDIDPGEISRRLKELRVKYRLLTLERDKKILTDRGKEALPTIRSLLRQSDQLADWLAVREQRPKVLSVACGSRVAQSLIPRTAALFVPTCPDWQIQVHIRRGRDRILGTADGTFDLALLSHEPAQIQELLTANRGEQTRLEIEDLVREPLCLIARKNSAAGNRLGDVFPNHTLPRAWLAQFPLAGLDAESGLRRQLERIGGRPLRFCVEGGGGGTALGCARHGLGAAVVPLSLLTRDDRDDLMICLLPEAVSITERLIHRPGSDANEHQALRDALRASARKADAEMRKEWQRELFP